MIRCYDYECKCGNVWEHYQQGYDTVFNCQECPQCGSKKIIRLFPAPVGKVAYEPEHPRAGRGRAGKRKMTINEGYIAPNTDEKGVGPIHFKHTIED